MPPSRGRLRATAVNAIAFYSWKAWFDGRQRINA
jgi:hypothetical protein